MTNTVLNTLTYGVVGIAEAGLGWTRSAPQPGAGQCGRKAGEEFQGRTDLLLSDALGRTVRAWSISGASCRTAAGGPAARTLPAARRGPRRHGARGAGAHGLRSPPTRPVRTRPIEPDGIMRVELTELLRELDHAFPVILSALQQAQVARHAPGVHVQWHHELGRAGIRFQSPRSTPRSSVSPSSAGTC